MTFDPERHHRRSIRLRGYDYRQAGAYYVTICVLGRVCLFGDVDQSVMNLSPLGEIVAACWEGLAEHYEGVTLDAFVVVPNHVHGIIMLEGEPDAEVGAGTGLTGAGIDTRAGINTRAGIDTRAGLKPAPTRRHGLPEVVRGFKTFSARRINEVRGTPGEAVWQRNYYEHVVRDDADLDRIRRYIAANPDHWAEDEENPAMWNAR